MRIVRNALIGVAVIVAIFVLGCLLLDRHLKNCTEGHIKSMEKADRHFIVKEIENYQSKHNRLPASLSELDFEQTPTLYIRNNNNFWLIRLSDSFVLEYWDRKGSAWQYVSEDRKWYNERRWEFEPPINIDTIAAINRISNFEKDYNIPPTIDSIGYNHLRIYPIYDMTDEIPDSVAYIKYLYAGGSPRCEGWVVFFDDPEDDFSHEWGEWRYYDEQGNCYRKFWNYKKDGELVYEADW